MRVQLEVAKLNPHGLSGVIVAKGYKENSNAKEVKNGQIIKVLKRQENKIISLTVGLVFHVIYSKFPVLMLKVQEEILRDGLFSKGSKFEIRF